MTTSIDYPDTLPTPLIATLKGGLLEAFKDDPAGVGSSRRRTRYTRTLERFSFSCHATEAPRVKMDSFYADTLLNGALSFNWTHPLSGVSFEVKFVGRPDPTMRSGHSYTLAVALEEI